MAVARASTRIAAHNAHHRTVATPRDAVVRPLQAKASAHAAGPNASSRLAPPPTTQWLFRSHTPQRYTLARGFLDKLFGGGPSDERADAANDSDGQEASDLEHPFLEDIVEGTFLEGRTLKLAYKATRDGFSCLQFHKRCDYKGPCVVLCTTKDGLRCGGFNPQGWIGSDDYKDAFNAFLFYLPDAKSDRVEYCEKVGGSGAAIFDWARAGPTFGADALSIGPPLSPVMGGFAGPESESVAAGDMRTAKSRLGSYYAARADGCTSLFGKKNETKLTEVEVYYAPEIAAMY